MNPTQQHHSETNEGMSRVLLALIKRDEQTAGHEARRRPRWQQPWSPTLDPKAFRSDWDFSA